MLEIVLPEKADAVIGFCADAKLQARIEEVAQKSMKANSRKMSAPNTQVTCGRTSCH